MLRKLYTAFVLVPLGVLLVVLAIANRHPTTVSLDPFGANSPSLSATVPLFMLILFMLLAGVIAGGLATWFNQGKWRREARRLASQVRALRIEREALKAQLAAKESAPAAAAVPPVPPYAPSPRSAAALPAPLQPV